MPKIKRNEYVDSNLYEEDYVTMEYDNLIRYLHSTFGIPMSMIEYHPCAGDESLFLRFREQSFWLFEIDEEQYYSDEEWYDYVQHRLNVVYLKLEELLETK